jgi:DNA-binding PadR family transcriptional regulator
VVASKVEVVVLGLLEEGPVHGYDLLERFRDRSMGFWVEVGKASVYQTLRRLELGGFVAGRAQDGTDGPDRRVFRITVAGRRRLREDAAELAMELAPFETGAGTAMGIVSALPAADAKVVADAREQTLRDLLEGITAERSRHAAERGPARAISDAMLGRQQALVQAELEWLRSFRSVLGKGHR